MAGCLACKACTTGPCRVDVQVTTRSVSQLYQRRYARPIQGLLHRAAPEDSAMDEIPAPSLANALMDNPIGRWVTTRVVVSQTRRRPFRPSGRATPSATFRSRPSPIPGASPRHRAPSSSCRTAFTAFYNLPGNSTSPAAPRADFEPTSCHATSRTETPCTSRASSARSRRSARASAALRRKAALQLSRRHRARRRPHLSADEYPKDSSEDADSAYGSSRNGWPSNTSRPGRPRRARAPATPFDITLHRAGPRNRRPRSGRRSSARSAFRSRS